MSNSLSIIIEKILFLKDDSQRNDIKANIITIYSIYFLSKPPELRGEKTHNFDIFFLNERVILEIKLTSQRNIKIIRSEMTYCYLFY